MKCETFVRVGVIIVAMSGISCTGHISAPSGGPPQAVPMCSANPTPPTLAFLNSGKRNGEFSLAFDPRSTAAQGGSQLVYAAGQELTLGNTAFPACIIAKKTVVFVSDQGGQPGTWKVAPGSQDLPGANNPQAANPRSRLSQSQVWATDEVIRVASDGTVYLTLLDTAADASCDVQFTFDAVPFDQVEIYASPPGATSFKFLAAKSDAERAGTRPTGSLEFYDLPQLAVNPSDPTQAVVFFTTIPPGSPNEQGEVCTVHRAADDTLTRPAPCQNFLIGESNIAFDTQGHLYGVTPSPNLTVTQFSLVGGTWTPGAQGTPPALGYFTLNPAGIPLDAGEAFGVLDDSTPAMAVGTIQGDTEPSIFLAFQVPRVTNADFPTVQVFGSKVSQMGTNAGWGAGLQVPEPPGTISLFHPGIALNTVSNVLDVVAMQTSPAATADQTPINTVWTRFDPARLHVAPPAPVQIVSPTPPLVSDLSRREPQFATQTPNTLFVGEYLGLDVRGNIPLIAFPEKTATQFTSMAISLITPLCDTAEESSSALTDDAWECTCACQNLHTLSSNSIKIQGCAPAGATAAAACVAICPGRADGAAPFSDPIACGGSGFPTTARRLTLQACRVSDGARPGGLVTDAADVVAASDSTSAITLHRGSSIFQTALAGTVSLNLGGPPHAGTTLELARLDLEPDDLFATVGGVSTHVHDFALSHQGRLSGVFTDATHFALAPAAGQLDLSFTISQGCIDPCPDQEVTVHKANFQPVTGAVDLVSKTISFDINESSGNDGASIHFGGAVTAVPLDTDNDGVFDGADNCPLIANPTQQRVASPQITAPANTTVTNCQNPTLGTPTVTDVCGAGGIAVTNNAPLTFPSGQTVVTWTATDGRGNSATATQTVTSVDPETPYVQQLANGNMRYSITLPAPQQAYVEAFVRQNGVQNISGNIVSSQVHNADGTFTYSRVVSASQYHAGDTINVRFYSYRSGQLGVFTPGPVEWLSFPDFIYGTGASLSCSTSCRPTFTQLPDGSVKLAHTFTTPWAYVEAFVLDNGTQIASGNIVQSGITNLDGTYTYNRILPASTFKSGDVVTFRYYSYVTGGPQVFTPGPTASILFPGFIYGLEPTSDCQ
jgi:hypothetical protein